MVVDIGGVQVGLEIDEGQMLVVSLVENGEMTERGRVFTGTLAPMPDTIYVEPDQGQGE